MLVDADDPDAIEAGRVVDQDPAALGQDRGVSGVPGDPERPGDPGDREVLADDRDERPAQRTERQLGSWLRGFADVLAPDVPAAGAPVAVDRDEQRRGSPPERLVRQRAGDAVSRGALAAAPPAPPVGCGDPAGQQRPARFELLTGDLKTEVVEPAERGQVRAREGSVQQRRGPSGGSVRTPILEGPRPSSGQRRADYLYTLDCEEPVWVP